MRPTVINDTLISAYMVEYNRENKIFDDDDREVWELTHLALSFRSRFTRPILIVTVSFQKFCHLILLVSLHYSRHR